MNTDKCNNDSACIQLKKAKDKYKYSTEVANSITNYLLQKTFYKFQNRVTIDNSLSR